MTCSLPSCDEGAARRVRVTAHAPHVILALCEGHARHLVLCGGWWAT